MAGLGGAAARHPLPAGGSAQAGASGARAAGGDRAPVGAPAARLRRSARRRRHRPGPDRRLQDRRGAPPGRRGPRAVPDEVLRARAAAAARRRARPAAAALPHRRRVADLRARRGAAAAVRPHPRSDLDRDPGGGRRRRLPAQPRPLLRMVQPQAAVPGLGRRAARLPGLAGRSGRGDPGRSRGLRGHDRAVSEPFYLPLDGSDGERFHATTATTGPWFAEAQHAGPPTALLVRALERCAPQARTQIGRITVDVLGPIPAAEVTVRAAVERPGRSVALLAAELTAGGRAVLRARAWRLTEA